MIEHVPRERRERQRTRTLLRLRLASILAALRLAVGGRSGTGERARHAARAVLVVFGLLVSACGSNSAGDPPMTGTVPSGGADESAARAQLARELEARLAEGPAQAVCVGVEMCTMLLTELTLDHW